MNIILTGIFIFIFIILFCAAMAYLFDFFKNISKIIEKRKRKKIIKKLKEMPTWDETCINLLKSLQKEEKDGN